MPHMFVWREKMGKESSEAYTLTPEQLKSYDDTGFLLIKRFLDPSTLERYKERFVEICDGKVDKKDIVCIKETALDGRGLGGEDLINKLHDIHFDDVFGTYFDHPKLVDVASQLIRTKDHGIRAICGMFINKPPGSVAHPQHQDLVYFPVRPASKVTATWTAIDRVTADNGALYMVPGSHKAGLLYEHAYIPGSNKAFHGILDETVVQQNACIVIEMEPGDTVFFHPLTIHGSRDNVTKNHRKSITAHYASEQTYFVEVCGGPAAQVARDVDQVMRRRGWNVTYEELVRYKSKPVREAPPRD